jgi:Domain of unknown function (DUF4430)
VSLRRIGALLLALALLSGCGEEAAGSGAAQLWITRDRGSEVLLTTSVPAGISAMEALRRKADVETRYGGRFVQSIDGIDGGLAQQRDWFFYVNGYEGDLSAAEYTLHEGDVLWWDYRDWGGQLRVPVVVGAFPEPFRHGWAGKRRPTVIEGGPNALRARLAKVIGSSGGRRGDSNRLMLVPGVGFHGTLTGSPGDAVVFTLGRKTATRLLENPSSVRYRYELP